MKILLRNNKDRNRINTYKNISSNVECIATIEKVVSVGKGLELVHNTNELSARIISPTSGIERLSNSTLK
jgi:hypothetical protein